MEDLYEDDDDICTTCWCGAFLYEEECLLHKHEEKAYRFGAAVAFGLMGMAEAIKRNGPPLVERHYFVSEIDGVRRYTCYCPGCGAYMKRLTAGEDEGTDNEWCGACRY